MQKIFLLTAVLTCMVITLMAQTALWSAKFNGSAGGDDAITAMVTDAAGNVYVTGYANNGSTGTDYVTIKYRPDGARQWIAVYNGPGSGDDVANSICIDKSGNVFVTGKSDSLPGAFIDNNATTVKYNANGKRLWVASYDGGVQRADVGRAIKADVMGNVYITGYTSERTGAHANANYLTVKYNAAGVQQWASIYAGPARPPDDQDDSANSISLDAAGNAYVTGMSNGDNDGLQNLNQDYLTVKYNATGVQQWAQRYNGPGLQIDEAFGLVTDAQGNAYVTGVSTGANNNSYDYATLKYSTTGQLLWTQRHNGTGQFSADLAFAIAMDDTGNIYVTGSDQAKTDNEDIYTIKYNAAGVQQWAARYDGGDNDNPSSLAIDKTGNVYVAGYTTRIQTFIDCFLVKYNNSGIQQWTQKFKGTEKYAWDVWNAVGTDSLDNVYVAGYVSDKNKGTDYQVLKYSSVSFMNEDKMQHSAPADPITLFENTPNPFTRSTTISFSVQNGNATTFEVKLWIEDASGNLISVLMSQKLNTGVYKINWDARQNKPGIYYCRLQCGEERKAIKLVLVH